MHLEEIKTDDTYTHLVLRGKLDITGVQEIESKFISAIASRKLNALVDIGEVTFIGSMALRLFLSVAKSLSWEKKTLILLNPQPMVAEVLEASSFQDIVVIEHNANDAIARAKA